MSVLLIPCENPSEPQYDLFNENYGKISILFFAVFELMKVEFRLNNSGILMGGSNKSSIGRK